MGRLEGRTCMVTGVGRGIGRGIALRTAAEGASVAIADIHEEGAAAVAEEITRAGGQALGLACDVADRASVRSAIAATAERFGRLDVLFNNAGISPDDDTSILDT